MRVQFEITIDDLVDCSKRVLARSKSGYSKWQGAVYSALVGWLLAFVVITYFYGRPDIAAPIALVLAALCAVLYPSSYEQSVDKRLRTLHLAELNGANTVICVVELTTQGVQVKQMNRLIIYEWPGVVEIQDTADSIDIYTQDLGVLWFATGPSPRLKIEADSLKWPRGITWDPVKQERLNGKGKHNAEGFDAEGLTV